MRISALLAVSAVLVSSAFAQPEIGQPAPDFTLNDASGKSHSLASLKGKYVVLEWVNFGCPFVKKHYESGNMQKLQKDAADKGVVWLSICSSAPGKQGHLAGDEAEAAVKRSDSAASAYLIDDKGEVGRKYEARTTPEMFVINPEGILIYKGAIDDRPTPSAADIEGAKNHVTAALAEALAGQPVTNASTKPYGCSVKY
ncbi:MAG TPA: thioredoxin family protein [Terrimicrobiaceae bacterium]|nr:thioredoxin family protein [Terrimicrobiaceae bacterium]